MIALSALLLCGAQAAPAAADYRDPEFDYVVAGEPDSPRAAHTQFGLALFGGGGRVDSAFAFLAQRGGHGHVVILRATRDAGFDADTGDYGRSFMDHWGPVTSAETIVFRSRKASFDSRVIHALANADAIFLAGGDQSNYVRFWKGTPVQAALDAHVRAGRPLGGSSAGLAILGHYSYSAMDGGSLESRAALLAPLGSAVTLEDDFLHLVGLEHVITDTHFARRARLGRLIVFVARLQSQHHGSILGVGIDERSALLVDADGTARLAADSAGNAWIVTVPAVVLHPGEAFSATGIRITRMDKDSRLNLRARYVTAPAGVTLDGIERGHPVSPSFATPLLLREAAPAGED